MINQYRKKPVVVDAIQLTKDTMGEVKNFIGADFDGFNENGLKVKTLEGTLQASWGDIIIRGIKGEHYPCEKDIFHMTYEEV